MSKMSIFLSSEAASPQWGQSALLSYSDAGITIHYKKESELDAIQRAGRKIESQGIQHCKLEGEGWNLEANWHFWLGYRHPKNHQTVNIEWSKLSKQDEQELKNRLLIIDWTRDCINQPAEEQSPIQLAQNCSDLLASFTKNITYKFVTGEALKDNNYMGIYTVGKGSIRPPVLLELDYNPTQNDDMPVMVSLIGKGITFDSGGYSLKPSSFMESMRSDMGGAALVTGALALAIARGLNYRVKLYLCCADNLVSGNAFKLGDVIYYP